MKNLWIKLKVLWNKLAFSYDNLENLYSNIYFWVIIILKKKTAIWLSFNSKHVNFKTENLLLHILIYLYIYMHMHFRSKKDFSSKFFLYISPITFFSSHSDDHMTLVRSFSKKLKMYVFMFYFLSWQGLPHLVHSNDEDENM